MTPEQIIDLTNQYRKEQGLVPLKPNKQLMAAAAERAKDMAKTGAFSHTVATTTPNVTWNTFIHKSGYKYQNAGENLATLFNDAPSIVDAWKKSPTHNKNLVKPNYSEIGIGIMPGKYQGKDTYYVVQYFGNPQNPQVSVTPAPATPTPIQKTPKPKNTAQPSPKKAPTKLGYKPDLSMANTTPQVVPNKLPPKPLSL